MNSSAKNRSQLKRFLTRTAVGAIPVMLLAGVMAYFAIAVRPMMSGDLGVLGKIAFSPEYTEEMYRSVPGDILVRWYPSDSALTEVVTIGDSFSLQVQNGYQNFLAHQLGKPVTLLLTQQTDFTAEQCAVDLLNSGFFEEHPQIKTIIIEAVERQLVRRWTTVDFNSAPATDFFLDREPGVTPSEKEEDRRNYFGNVFKEGLDWLKIRCGFAENPVREVALSKDCFTLPGKADRLYFYQDDLECLSATEEDLDTIQNNMQRLHDMFAARGIRMLFLMACDKYELYQHLATDNPYPERPLGHQLTEIFAPLDYVVNPLPELTRMLDAGEKDLFMADDSHWSWKSARTAASQLYDKIREPAGN